jgi:DNA repair protein RadD
MATGTGKSVVIASLAKRLLTNWPDMRVLMLVHVRELVQQNAQAMLRNWPQAPIGINSAGLGRRDRHSRILFASIQSVYRIAAQLGPRDVVMVDECHLLPRDGDGMYRSLLEKLRDAVPDLRVCGFTATPYRLDSGRLDEGDGRLFDEVVYAYDLGRAVTDGYLSPLVSRATATEIDVSGVARKGGEFVAGSLEAAADRVEVIEGACDEMLQLAADRRSWLVFCSGIIHAQNVCRALRRRGISCETVTGKTPSSERAHIFKSFKEGRIRCLTGVQVFTTGFDAPAVDMIGLLRPTLSTGLYVQMLGRGTRIADGKSNCLVLDFAGNVRRHGPVDAVSVTSKKKDGGAGKEKTDPDTVRAKICPVVDCLTYNALSALTCTNCGYEWPKPEPKHGAEAEAEPVMTSEIKNKWIAVNYWNISRHQKSGGGPDSLVVEYCCGLKTYKEWICPEHTGYARAKFQAWWHAMGGSMPFPHTIDDALARSTELSRADAITIAREEEWWRVINRRVERYDGMMFEIDNYLRVRPAQIDEMAS